MHKRFADVKFVVTNRMNIYNINGSIFYKELDVRIFIDYSVNIAGYSPVTNLQHYVQMTRLTNNSSSNAVL